MMHPKLIVRKIVPLGISCYVALPPKWMKSELLMAGDFVSVVEDGNRVIIRKLIAPPCEAAT
jgi:hypothetical protein